MKITVSTSDDQIFEIYKSEEFETEKFVCSKEHYEYLKTLPEIDLNHFRIADLILTREEAESLIKQLNYFYVYA